MKHEPNNSDEPNAPSAGLIAEGRWQQILDSDLTSESLEQHASLWAWVRRDPQRVKRLAAYDAARQALQSNPGDAQPSSFDPESSHSRHVQARALSMIAQAAQDDAGSNTNPAQPTTDRSLHIAPRRLAKRHGLSAAAAILIGLIPAAWYLGRSSNSAPVSSPPTSLLSPAAPHQAAAIDSRDLDQLYTLFSDMYQANHQRAVWLAMDGAQGDVGFVAQPVSDPVVYGVELQISLPRHETKTLRIAVLRGHEAVIDSAWGEKYRVTARLNIETPSPSIHVSLRGDADLGLIAKIVAHMDIHEAPMLRPIGSVTLDKDQLIGQLSVSAAIRRRALQTRAPTPSQSQSLQG